VLALVLLLVLGIGLQTLDMQLRRWVAQSSAEIASRVAADAGLEKAIYEMNRQLSTRSLDNDQLPHVIREPLPACDAVFSYQVEKGSGSDYTLKSFGQSGRTYKQVNAILGLKGLFDHAILSRDRISLMPNTTVTGYNSLDPCDTDPDLAIGTVSVSADRITLGPGSVIEGDVLVGVGGDPDTVVGAGGTIMGMKYSMPEEPPLPTITPPALPDAGTVLNANGATMSIGPADSASYSAITLSGKGVLEITGGDVALHVAGDVDLGQDCEIIVRPDSSLRLYVDGTVYSASSGTINNQAGNIRDFQLYSTSTETQAWDLKAKSTVFGIIYAPNVDITFYPKAEVHGCIVGADVQLKSGGTFYYDEALRQVELTDEGVRFVMKRWFEP